ncbi:hypothetical protein AB4225_35075 [Streptomyces sp. 2RAF24]|uniref:hypothetical protein n=1 Tax=Streptomyces sp. 2RAF24 TaxID=3232997 RepID=UPI003F9CC1BD
MHTTKPPAASGPQQFPDALAAELWRFERALAHGLIPPADVHGCRWSATVLQAALDAKAEIWPATGTLPDKDATRPATLLAERFGIPVDADVLPELDRKGLIPRTDDYKSHPLYDGLATENVTHRTALDKARRDGRLLDRHPAARHPAIRDSNFTHLTRPRWLRPATHVRSRHQPRSWAPSVPLYRLGDLDVLLAHPAIDWDDVRATPKGRPSALAHLTVQNRVPESEKGLQGK